MPAKTKKKDKVTKHMSAPYTPWVHPLLRNSQPEKTCVLPKGVTDDRPLLSFRQTPTGESAYGRPKVTIAEDPTAANTMSAAPEKKPTPVKEPEQEPEQVSMNTTLGPSPSSTRKN